MKIQRLSHSDNSNEAYKKRHDQKPQNHHLWHDHKELEFIQIIKGSGSVCIGDCIQKFGDGDLFLIGSNLSHYWLFDDEYMNAHENLADIKVIHFLPDFCGDKLLALSGSDAILRLYQKANKGILFPKNEPVIGDFFKHLFNFKGIQQITSLLEILEYCNSINNITLLASNNYAILNQEDDYNRMNIVMEYIRVHYKSQVRLDDVAQLAGMTSNSFCRYFKSKTGKTLLSFLTEIRIATACKQLKESNISIKEMSYDCGFNNFVSFHKAFKRITGKTPMEYRHAM